MPNLVTVAQSDSTNDGSGASTTIEPPQVDNIQDDLILIKVTQSLNNSNQVSDIDVATPLNYTELANVQDSEVRSWLFYKKSTGSETIPQVESDRSAKWTCSTVVVTDVDWDNGGIGSSGYNTGQGDQQSPNLTTSSSGAASVIVCFYSLERRTIQGFRYPDTRAQSVYAGAVSTGTSEGVDNSSGVGYDFITDRNKTWKGVFWEASNVGDSLAINVEVIVKANIIPLQSSTYVKQLAPTNTMQTTMDWCREIVNGGKDLDGNTLNTWTFDASTANTSSNRVTVTGHGMDESMVVYLKTNGNTAPTGLADDTFYYVEPMSANEIRFRNVNEDTDSASDHYANGTSKRPVVGISSTGIGSITLIEARMVNAPQAELDILRPAGGDSSNAGLFSGNYIGDGGYNQNFIGVSQRFNSLFDATGETIFFELQVSGTGRLDRVIMTLIDEDGDWMNWKLYQRPESPISTGQRIYQFQVDKDSVKALKYKECGTFDHERIRYFVITARGNNASANRFNAVNSATSAIYLGGTFTVVNGQSASFSELVELSRTYIDSIKQPEGSDLQVLSTIPISIGDGTSDVSFIDSEKSIAFPPLADGVNTFESYLDTIGVKIKATQASTVKLTNSQIGASSPYTFELDAADGSTVDLTGNSYVFATATLDADTTYNRQLFVGGEGIEDNGSQIRNSTFIVNNQLVDGTGMINWESSTDIESSTFELKSDATGHAIKINTLSSATSFIFEDLTFDNFGDNETESSAILNASGQEVTINILGGNAPTVKNINNSTTIIKFPDQGIRFNNLKTGSQVVVFKTGEINEGFRKNNSSSTETAVLSLGAYDFTVMKAGFFPIRVVNVQVSEYEINDIDINQLIDRAYQTSSGLTYSTNANVDTSNKKFSVSVATTVQNYYSFWIEQWISNSVLRNTKFPISTFGGNSFSFDDGYEFTSSSLEYLSRDGFRYFDNGIVTARYAAILSQGVSAGLQAEYQQAKGGSISDAQNTGDVDQVIQIYGDSGHGGFNYTDYLIFKVQGNGFRQAEANIVSVFGTLEEQFYVTSLNTLAIPNFTIGIPNVTGLQIIDEGENPDPWDAGDGTSRKYRLTIKDTGNNTGENILRWLNYNLSLDDTFEDKNPFYYPEMVIDNGSSYETIRGVLYGSTSNVLAGVRVIDGNGDAHRDFTRFQSDNGEYGTPLEIKTGSITGITTGSRLRIYNKTTSQETFNDVITGTFYEDEYTEGDNYSQEDQLEITLTYQIGTTAKIPLISQAIVGATGWSLLVDQKDLTAYSSLGADGSMVTEYNIDSDTNNLEIDADDTDCSSSKRRLVARYYYLITTEEGIKRYVNAIVLEDEANAIIDRTITDLTVDNVGGCTLNLTDSDFRLYTSNGSSWIKNPPTNGYGIISDSGKVYVKGQEELENKVQNLVDAENADIFVTPTRFTKKIAGTETVILEKTYTSDGQGTESLTEIT